MLIFIAVVVTVGVIVVAVLVALSGAYAELKVTQSINESATSALNRMVLEIRQASAVDTATSTFGVDPGILGLDTKDEGGNDVTIAFHRSDGVLKVVEDGVSAGALTRSDVTVKQLLFERFVNGESEAIHISLTLEGSAGTVMKEETFFTTAILRGAYGL